MTAHSADILKISNAVGDATEPSAIEAERGQTPLQTERIRSGKLPIQHRFHLLDALRGLAALLVVSRHAPAPLFGGWAPFDTFLAVDFFFGLSGFVVAFSYEQRLSESLRFREFAITRIIRLYPIAILGTLLGAFAEIVFRSTTTHIHSLWLTVPVSVTLGTLVLPAPNGFLFPLDPPMWTLFFEIIANFVCAYLLRKKLLSTNIVCSISLLSLALLLVSQHHFHQLDLGWKSDSAVIGLARVGFSFFVGVLLYRLYRKQRQPRIEGPRAVLGAMAISVLFVLVLCNSFRWTRTEAAEAIIVAVIFPSIIYFASMLELPRRWIAVCAFLGTISYPVYLIHEPLLILIWPAHRFIYLGTSPLGFAFAAVSILMLAAWLIATFYDVPLRCLLTRRVRQRQFNQRSHSEGNLNA